MRLVSGFYRVNYDAKNWQLIGDQLRRNHTMIHVINRAQILDDVFNLARAGVVDYPLALGFTRYLDREMDYVAWRPANKGLSFIGKMFKRTPGYGEYLVGQTAPAVWNVISSCIIRNHVYSAVHEEHRQASVLQDWTSSGPQRVHR